MCPGYFALPVLVGRRHRCGHRPEDSSARTGNRLTRNREVGRQKGRDEGRPQATSAPASRKSSTFRAASAGRSRSWFSERVRRRTRHRQRVRNHPFAAWDRRRYRARASCVASGGDAAECVGNKKPGNRSASLPSQPERNRNFHASGAILVARDPVPAPAYSSRSLTRAESRLRRANMNAAECPPLAFAGALASSPSAIHLRGAEQPRASKIGASRWDRRNHGGTWGIDSAAMAMVSGEAKPRCAVLLLGVAEAVSSPASFSRST